MDGWIHIQREFLGMGKRRCGGWGEEESRGKREREHMSAFLGGIHGESFRCGPELFLYMLTEKDV